MMDMEKIIEKLKNGVKRTYAIKTEMYEFDKNGYEKISEEITEHREPFVTLTIEMADKILALLKEQEEKMKHLNNITLEYEKEVFRLQTLLKEQEAVTIKKTKEHGFGVYGGICPKCRNWIQSAHSYCGFCGQAVKWNEG